MVRSIRILGVLALGLWLAAPSAAQPDVTRRIVVFAPHVPRAQRLLLAQSSGARIVRELALINAVVVEAQTTRVHATDAMFQAMSGVSRVDEDPSLNWLLAADARGVDFSVPHVRTIAAPVHDLKWKWKWKWPWRRRPGAPPGGQETPWGISRVQAPDAWALTRGQGVKVAVIDTGIDGKHPDLAANVRGGWNAITQGADFTDDNGHGSHVAGTIAAVDDKQGVVGVAPQASLYGVKVLSASGSGTFDDVIAGMQWAVDNKMDIASMSLGASEGNQSLTDMVAAMKKAGVILIAAAGNSGGSVGFPAACPGAIAVAASTEKNKLASFSSRGPEVAVIAPGVDVKSTYKDGGQKVLSGTSMATPHVSGLAALFVSRNRGATPDQALAALRAASSKLPGVPDIGQGAGLPSAVKLVR